MPESFETKLNIMCKIRVSGFYIGFFIWRTDRNVCLPVFLFWQRTAGMDSLLGGGIKNRRAIIRI